MNKIRIRAFRARQFYQWHAFPSLILAFAACGGCGGAGGQQQMGPPPPTLSFITASLAGGMAGFPYSQTVEVVNATAPVSWSVSGGMFPHGLALSLTALQTRVTITGTPDIPENQMVTLQVKDGTGQTASRTYAINIQPLAVVQLQESPGGAPGDTVEIQGLSAGPFDPGAWQQSTLNWVPDVRAPILAAQTTSEWQNIYAPWPLEQSNGWRLFYGGWDGVETPNDRVYSTTTADFLSFENRHLVIDHGLLDHVNNANVTQLPDGSLHMIYGFLAAPNGLDRIAYAFSPDGTSWNGSPEPYTASETDMVNVTGDILYNSSDYNGGNVLLRDNGAWSLYYSKGAFGRGSNSIYRATSNSPPDFTAAGTAVASGLYANDVKVFQAGGQTWYLMLLYYEAINVGEPPANFFFCLSTDPTNFTFCPVLFGGYSAVDKYPTTPALVTRKGHVLGVMYGADPYDFLDAQDQIFARWLQKRVVLQDSSGASYQLQGGYGPDRQWWTAPGTGVIQGTLYVYAENGITPLGTAAVTLSAGKSYQLIVP